MPTRKELANAIRFLAIDAVQQANSGHPGMPMGMADIAEVVWNDFLTFNPKNPEWINRDRFVLSNGHGCMLQYALLHLTGYNVSIDEIKNFRQLHSKTPGHPEVGDTPGIETTTGPLGQGLANAVGMALAEKMLAAHFNRDGHDIIDHYTYVFAGDGCLMEGVSHETCALAGTWGLGKLVLLFDDNGISIDGKIVDWCTTDVPARFKSYGWDVIADVDGHDPDAIKQAIEKAKSNTEKPTIICCKTTIGFGSPHLAGSEKTHGAPLGADEIAATRKALNWAHEPFNIPADVYQAFDASQKGAKSESDWQAAFLAYQAAYPDLSQELLRRMKGDLPENFSQAMYDYLEEVQSEKKDTASRKSSHAAIEKAAPLLPELIGGSADLTGSNLTSFTGMQTYQKNKADANYLYYGVREFGMAAIMNGLVLHGGFIPFGGTFLVFQSYCANATRMSALMNLRVIYVFTHDSIGLGEDGPTHQPVMEAQTLRMTPGMQVWRPCDTAETVVAWQKAIESKHAPTSLLLSRQTLPAQSRNALQVNAIQRGGYILKDSEDKPDVILIATGSEVGLAMTVANAVKDKNIRVVSMPCCELFDAQDDVYKESVLPKDVSARIAIEAAAGAYWYKYVGLQGRVIGLDRFGVSAPAKDAYNECGFTVEALISAVEDMLLETV